jgi:hypothetical protein
MAGALLAWPDPAGALPTPRGVGRSDGADAGLRAAYEARRRERHAEPGAGAALPAVGERHGGAAVRAALDQQRVAPPGAHDAHGHPQPLVVGPDVDEARRQPFRARLRHGADAARHATQPRPQRPRDRARDVRDGDRGAGDGEHAGDEAQDTDVLERRDAASGSQAGTGHAR